MAPFDNSNLHHNTTFAIVLYIRDLRLLTLLLFLLLFGF